VTRGLSPGPVTRSASVNRRTPVSAYPLGDGSSSPFCTVPSRIGVRNVLAAGTFTLRTKGRDYLLERPEIISPTLALPAFPVLSRRTMRSRGIQDFVWGHRAR
jgi:hypothetical protein